MHQKVKISSNQPAVPSQRYELRAEIIRAGFRSYSGFARGIGIDPAYISRILNGFLFPSAKVQRLIAKELKLSLRELVNLL